MNGRLPALTDVVDGFGGTTALRRMLREPSQILLSDSGSSSIRRSFGIQRIDEILAVSTLEPYVVALHDSDVEIDQRTFIDTRVGDGQIIKRTLGAATLVDALRRGLTLTINGADRFDALTLRIREYLEYAAAALAWCNIYLSRSAMSPFDTHTDNHHVIAVQGEGRKHWTVLEPDSGEVVFDDWLQAGQSLFVPAHWPHRVHGSDEVSVHWTFGLSPHTEPYRALEDVVSGHVADGDLEKARAELAKHLAGDTVRQNADLRRRRAGVSLAYQMLDSSAVALQDVTIRFASRLPPILGACGAGIVVIAAGSLYKVDGRLLPALGRLSDGLPVPASELAPEVGEKATRTFIEWGVGNGLLLADVERIERS